MTFVSTQETKKRSPQLRGPFGVRSGQAGEVGQVVEAGCAHVGEVTNSGGALTDSGLAPRGANTAEELERQLSKLTTALLGLKADVIGLMELENDADDATLKTIVDRLNGALPANSGRAYSHVPTGLIGSDAIKVGLIYNNLAVAANGAARVLDTAAFTDPLASGTPKNRPALAQTFRELASGETVNVVVNHLKSKGATDATGADLDQRDGQAAFNATRTAAAARLLEWIKTNPTGNGDPDWVVLGDLNAYAKEDPIQVFEAAGYRNALPSFTAEPPSSYAFFTPVDMSGALDHMLISPSLVPQATAALDWNINAAEGAFRDYNRDTNSNGNAAVRDFFSPDPYRTSEHVELVIACTAQGAVGRAADDEGVVAKAAADAVAIAGFGTEPIIATPTGDHIAGAGVDGVYTGAREDAILEAVAEGHIHLVFTGAGEDGVADQREVLAGIRHEQTIGARSANHRGWLDAGQVDAEHEDLTAVIGLGGCDGTARLASMLSNADEDVLGERTALFDGLNAVASQFFL